MVNSPALSLDRIGIRFGTRSGVVQAVRDVSLYIDKGETVGLVGESGCGKTTLSRAAVKLVAVQEGKITVDGTDWTTLSSGRLRPFRRQVQMVFQNPYASLNPRMTIYDHLAEPLGYHFHLTKSEILKQVAALLERVGIDPQSMKRFPHEFSGGQRQRIAIARAIAAKPELLIADEPVSSLDVSIQAQILNLLMDLQKNMGLAMLFISHDLSVVKHISDRVAVMYLGRIVESGTREQVFSAPLHPYTMALLAAAVMPDFTEKEPALPLLLMGEPPSPLTKILGCSFKPRCRYAIDDCGKAEPSLEAIGGSASGHQAACIRKGDLRY